MKNELSKKKMALSILILIAGMMFVPGYQANADEYATAAELKLMEGFPPPLEKRVGRSNALFAPPFNRWSYQNMRAVYPTANIGNADYPVPLNKAIDGAIERLMVRKGESNDFVDMETYLKET